MIFESIDFFVVTVYPSIKVYWEIYFAEVNDELLL
jgi:hypothetical protein